MNTTNTIEIIGVPMDLGANRRGVDMGPSAIRYGGLEKQLRKTGHETIDRGDLKIPCAEECDPSQKQVEPGEAKFLKETAEACRDLTNRIQNTLKNNRFPVVLGGDHSLAIGSIKGSVSGASLGILWFDAHGDINTPESSPSGNIHGMSLAALLGDGSFSEMDWAHAPSIEEDDIVYVGLRSLDPPERNRIRESDIAAFTMSDIDHRGIGNVMEEALRIVTRGVDKLHVSLDMDWLNPSEAPGVGTPVQGGVTYREAHLAMEAIARRNEQESLLRSVDVVEVNPILDEKNRTAELAMELVASLLGKSIL